MRSERFHNRLKRQRYGIVGMVTLAVAALLVVIPAIALAGKGPISYTFVFEHTDGTTTEVSGVSNDNTAFLANAGGNDKDNPTGMTVHVSCSDKFPGGWGAKDGPSATADSEWRIRSFTIDKDGKLCTGGDPVSPKRPAIDIEKATNGEDADLPTGPQIPVGDQVTWTYVVTNTGDTALTDVKVVDYVPVVGSANATDVSCPKTTLAVGEVMTCTMTGVAALGQYENEAKVTALGASGVSASAVTGKKQYTFIFEHTDGTTTRIDGSSDKNEAFLPNAGGNDKDNPTGMTVHVSCSDKFPGGWGAKDGPSATADSEWHIAQFWIREIKNGEIKKSCGSPIPNEVMVMDQDPSHYIGVEQKNPDIDIEKATNGEDADTGTGPRILEGNRVLWTYVVTNTGDVDLFDVEVTDNLEGYIGTIALLEPGDVATLEHEGTAVLGQYKNTGCVVGTTVDKVEVSDCDPSRYHGDDPYESPSVGRIDIEKATNGMDADDPTGPRIPVGNTVTWTYTVTNVGDTHLWGVFVWDEQEDTRVDCPRRHLTPGESMTCVLSGTAQAGQYGNEAWVDAWDDDDLVSDTDWSHYFGVEDVYEDSTTQPLAATGLALEKRFNGDDADSSPGISVTSGSQVTVTYEITNGLDETVYGIYLFDEAYGYISCPSRSLSAGQSMTCTTTITANAGVNASSAWVDAWTDDLFTASDGAFYSGS
jgi:hypothetical protein